MYWNSLHLNTKPVLMKWCMVLHSRFHQTLFSIFWVYNRNSVDCMWLFTRPKIWRLVSFHTFTCCCINYVYTKFHPYAPTLTASRRKLYLITHTLTIIKYQPMSNILLLSVYMSINLCPSLDMRTCTPGGCRQFRCNRMRLKMMKYQKWQPNIWSYIE